MTRDEARTLVERAAEQYVQVCLETVDERAKLRADPRYRSPAIDRWLSAARAVLSTKSMLAALECE